MHENVDFSVNIDHIYDMENGHSMRHVVHYP